MPNSKTPTSRLSGALLSALNDKLSHSIPETARLLNMCNRSVYNEIADGRLASIKMRSKRQVTTAAILEYLSARESEAA